MTPRPTPPENTAEPAPILLTGILPEHHRFLASRALDLASNTLGSTSVPYRNDPTIASRSSARQQYPESPLVTHVKFKALHPDHPGLLVPVNHYPSVPEHTEPTRNTCPTRFARPEDIRACLRILLPGPYSLSCRISMPTDVCVTPCSPTLADPRQSTILIVSGASPTPEDLLDLLTALTACSRARLRRHLPACLANLQPDPSRDQQAHFP